MEIVGDRVAPEDAQRFREPRIRPAHPGIGVADHVGIEVHDLRRRVDTRVGASGGSDFYLRVGETLEGIFEMILHAASGWLGLPSAEGRAVVFETEGYAHGIPGRCRVVRRPG